MRFEIRSGGVGVILFGLVALSAMVFLFGLYEGYEIGIQSQSSSAQMATAYPLQAPPLASDNPANAETPVGGSSPASGSSAIGGNSPAAQNSLAATVPSPAASMAPSPPPSVAAATPEHPPERASAPRVADAGVTSVKVAPPPSAPEATASISPSPAAAVHTVSTEPAPASRRMPFNIQIQAAMDRKGADQMVQRLQQLGYQPHLVSTHIAGQTWYKVEVGPYASQDEAAVAEAELRQKYNSAFGGGGQPESPPDASGESTE